MFQGFLWGNFVKKSASFFLCLIILLAAGGFAFYLGWSQFKVEPGNVGILVSKTSGTNPVPITHDRFSWNWEFLIPTNASLLTFSPKPYTFEKVVGGVLPSGKEYEKVYGEAVDFSYSFVFSVTLKCTADEIASLVASKEISSQADLENLLERNALAACGAATNAAIVALEKGEVASVEGAKKIMEDAARNGVKNCSLESIEILSHSFPDIALYKSAKASYGDFVKKLEEAISEEARRAAEENSQISSAIKRMEILGETLKKYPELSDIIKNSNDVSKTLETINSMQ